MGCVVQAIQEVYAAVSVKRKSSVLFTICVWMLALRFMFVVCCESSPGLADECTLHSYLNILAPNKCEVQKSMAVTTSMF